MTQTTQAQRDLAGTVVYTCKEHYGQSEESLRDVVARQIAESEQRVAPDGEFQRRILGAVFGALKGSFRVDYPGNPMLVADSQSGEKAWIILSDENPIDPEGSDLLAAG